MSIVSLPSFCSKFNKRVFDTECAGRVANFCVTFELNECVVSMKGDCIHIVQFALERSVCIPDIEKSHKK